MESVVTTVWNLCSMIKVIEQNISNPDFNESSKGGLYMMHDVLVYNGECIELNSNSKIIFNIMKTT